MYKSAVFVKSIVNLSDLDNRLNEILFVGKSNVGKSTLINSLLNSKIAFVSKKPGHTRLLNYYLVNNSFYFVDSPGYGYSIKKDVDYEFYGNMLENYFKDNKYLKLIVFLLDSRRNLNEDDLVFLNFIKSFSYKYVICFTKYDKLNQSEKNLNKKIIEENFRKEAGNHMVFFSSKDNLKLVNELRKKIDMVTGGEL